MKQIVEKTNEQLLLEAELIRLAKAGNRHTFSQLIIIYQKDVFRLAYGFFHNRDDAMEIVQETFLKVYRKLDHYNESDPQAQFGKWVYRMAYNLCIDFYRKYKKNKAELKDIYKHHEERQSKTLNPESFMEQENFHHSLEESMTRLPKRQKTVFTLRHYSGLKHEEISGVLNISVGTIKTLYHRAIKNLKKQMAE